MLPERESNYNLEIQILQILQEGLYETGLYEKQGGIIQRGNCIFDAYTVRRCFGGGKNGNKTVVGCINRSISGGNSRSS